MTKRLFLFLPLLILIGLQVIAYAQEGDDQQINNLRLWHSPESTRIVFDVSADVKHVIFTLQNPLRLVVDIENAGLSMQVPEVKSDNGHIQNIRTGKPKEGVLRFVFELEKGLTTSSFVLSPNELYGHRLVIDLIEPNAVASVVPVDLDESSSDSGVLNETVNAPIEPSSSNIQSNRSRPEPTPTMTATNSNQKILIAIDAGHGGEDPGAIGYRGSKEKQITLAIANTLKGIIDADPRYESFMVRTGDYYVQLHDRRKLASDNHADMFISIHADAFTKSSASGFSVFALSQRGATSTMASALAAKENASDLIGGVSLANKDELVRKVLVDLAMTNTINESVNLGGRVLKELSKLGKMHSKRVEQAGFAVLKSPDIPSILIETGFITNPGEEQKLRTSSYQRKIADAVYTAVNQYFQQTPYYNVATYQSPAISDVSGGRSTSSANGYHTVVRGDSLSKIAEKYEVSLRELKQVNGLRSNVAMLGVKLKLPNGARNIPSLSNSTPAVHVVKRGDSLSKISANYNISISAIKRLNNLSKNTVYIGQKIKLPGGSGAASSVPLKHKVARGDTLSEIAEKYGSTSAKIMAANNMRSKTVVLGQILTIPR